MTLSKSDEVEVLIVAAEASSALYAQRLLEHWQNNNYRIKAFGIGSHAMQKLGFQCVGRSEELSVVGITEVIKHYGKIRGVFHELIRQAELRKPKVILLLDYPDFNLRLAKKLKPFGIPIVYYISPQVWAWRKSRIHIIKKYVDRMLVLLPFEKEFYSAHGVEVDFVGHPLLDEIDPKLFDQKERSIARKRYGVLDNELLVGLMPGSRFSEIKHHFDVQLRVAEKLYSQNKSVKFALLVAPTFSIDEFKKYLPSIQLPLQIIRDEPLKMVSLTDVVLCASGTATLVVGLMKKPMVIMYIMNTFSAWLAKLFVKGTAHFGLINLVLGERVVPELFQSDANVDQLSLELSRYLNDIKLRQQTTEKLEKSHYVLGQKGATQRVAQILNSYIYKT